MAFGRYDEDLDVSGGGGVPGGDYGGGVPSPVDYGQGGAGGGIPMIPGTTIPQGDYSGIGTIPLDGSGGAGGAGGAGGGGGFGGGGYSLNFGFDPVPVFNPDPFNAPTLDEAKKEPGYEFALGEGVTALDRSAAAKGGLRTGGHNKDILQYGQNLAAQTYSNVFDRALKSYGARYQAQHDSFAPRMAEWQRKAAAEQARQLAMFNAQFMAPRGGGGGNPMQDELDVLGPEPMPDTYGSYPHAMSY